MTRARWIGAVGALALGLLTPLAAQAEPALAAAGPTQVVAPAVAPVIAAPAEVGAAPASLTPSAQVAPAAPSAQGAPAAPTAVAPMNPCSGPNQPITCRPGGSEPGPGDGQPPKAGGGFDDEIGWTSRTCGSWGDLNGDGEIEYIHALHHPIAGWTMDERGCSITNNVTGEVLRWQVVFAAWVNKTGAGGAPVVYPGGGGPPTYCEGYNPSGNWYWGIVVGSATPQPIWGNPNTSVGVCPTPGQDPFEIAGDIVSEYIERTLVTAELAISPPEGEYPAAVGVPVRVWFEDAVPGETVGTEEPIVRTRGPVSVMMDIKLADVTLDWGDGTETTCEFNEESGTVGTPFEEGQDPLEFDSGCQHVYNTISEGEPDGSFTVTAHSNWEVTWSVTTSAGTEGDVFTGASQPSEVTVRVGEIQTYR